MYINKQSYVTVKRATVPFFLNHHKGHPKHDVKYACHVADHGTQLRS